MIKIRKPKSKNRLPVNEDLSKTTTKRKINKRKSHGLTDIANSVLQIKARRYEDLKKIYKRTMADYMSTKDINGVPLGKVRTLVKCNAKDLQTGKKYVKEIIPATTIQFCEKVKLQAERKGNLGIILKYFNKPIIWTWNVPTAASDGVRIAFNPLFADQLLDAGYEGIQNVMQQRMENNLPPLDKDAVSLYASRLFIFVLVHEAFHQIYRHREQAAKKPETENGKNHRLANIAMDAEINRDIERHVTPSSTKIDFDFKGATELAGGVYDSRFEQETWDLIFDAYYNGMEPPKQPFNQATTKATMNKPNQDEDEDDQDEQQDQQNQQGQQGQDDENGQPGQDGQSGQDGQDGQDGEDGQGQQGQGGDDGYDSQQGQGGDDEDGDFGDGAEGEGGDSGDFGDSDEYGNNGESDGDNEGGSNMPSMPNMPGMPGMDGMDGDISGNSNGETDMSDGEGGTSGDFDYDDSDFGESGYGDIDENNPLGTDLTDKSDDYRDAYGDELQKQLNKINGLPTDDEESTEGETAEQQEAREQARRDIQQALEDMEEDMENESNRDLDNEEATEIYKNAEINVETSSKMGGCDMLSKEEMSDLAKEAGQPYDAKDNATSPEQAAKDYMEKYGEEIKKLSPDLAKKLTDIMSKLSVMQPIGANWRSKLKKHFKDAVKGDIIYTRSKRTMAQKNRYDRYNPYKEIDDTLPEGANIFYLLDGSGSMWWAGGEKIFLRIFKEILEIEKKCKVLCSASAWFATNGEMPDERISLWDNKTPVHKILDKLGDAGQCSGTDISKNVVAITKKKVPYYYQTDKKHTTIMVFTDGEECGYEGFKVLRQIPGKILKDVVFVIINRRDSIGPVLNSLQKDGGIKLSNIIAICREEFDK